MRIRLDTALVKRGIVESRSEAARLVASGAVTVSGAFADKCSRLVAADEAIEVVHRPRYVSRGGDKLAHALESLGVTVDGRSVMDAGSSTGGFTDCLLQAGARRVFCVDVGTHQLHEKLRGDERIVLREQTNVRQMRRSDLPFAVSLVVADLSFISLTKVAEVLSGLPVPEQGHPAAQLVLLVKPQFEAGRAEVSKGHGVIRDSEVHARTVQEVGDAFVRCGGSVEGVVESPIKGADGNTEFLMLVEMAHRSLGCPA